MKPLFAILSSSLLLCSCADMYVTNATVNGSGAASTAAIDPKDMDSISGVRMVTNNCGVGAANPKAIYIRPFCIDQATVTGDFAHSSGEVPIRKALTPVSFASTLKQQLSKIAPARILEENEAPRTGWLVEGDFTMVDGGSPAGRFFLGTFGVGRSFLAMRVRVTDVDAGVVVYEFDVAGGSRLQGPRGTIRASGLGKATPFDLVNAAERIYLTLDPNPHRYGQRGDIALR
ncbi:MAG TPA: BREX system ATP-binding domain-containing protein [Chthoniobacterales bacterium]|nr:BREX system ATP-binding domain-containing protein [Chthoniobacterales bacterium]